MNFKKSKNQLYDMKYGDVLLSYSYGLCQKTYIEEVPRWQDILSLYIFWKKILKCFKFHGKNLHLITYNYDMFQECKIERDYVMKRSIMCEFEP